MRIAIIGPDFFSYASAIAENLGRRSGVYTKYYDERPSNTILVKILIRLRLGYLLGNTLSKYHLKIKNDINSNRYDLLISLASESLGPTWIDSINVQYKIFYMWDSLKNKPVFKSLIPHFNYVATFDPRDAEELRIPLIHLFAEDCFRVNEEVTRSEKLCFVGTVHSNRSEVLAAIESNHRMHGHYYYHSKLLSVLKIIFGRMKGSAIRKKITSEKISKENVANLFRSSHGVIDIAHAGQQGLTSRTFETLRAGAYLFTNNHQIVLKSVPESLRPRVRCISEALADRKLELAQLDQLDPESDYWLSLDRFCDEIMEMVP